MTSLNKMVRGILIVFPMAFIALGCSTQRSSSDSNSGGGIDTTENGSSQHWQITYFALNDDFQAIKSEAMPANSVVSGRVSTSEIYSRPVLAHGIPVCDMFREGQLTAKDTGKSFPVRADFRTGLFNILAKADGMDVKIHVTDEVIGDSFQINPQNVVAIEYRQSPNDG